MNQYLLKFRSEDCRALSINEYPLITLKIIYITYCGSFWEADILEKNSIIDFWETLHQKMNISIKYFCSKCEQIRSYLATWSHLLKKSLIENLFFFLQWKS